MVEVTKIINGKWTVEVMAGDGANGVVVCERPEFEMSENDAMDLEEILDRLLQMSPAR